MHISGISETFYGLPLKVHQKTNRTIFASCKGLAQGGGTGGAVLLLCLD